MKPLTRAYSLLISLLFAGLIVSCGQGKAGTTVETAGLATPTSAQKKLIEKPPNTVISPTPSPQPERPSTESKSISKTPDEVIRQSVELRILEIAASLPKYDRNDGNIGLMRIKIVRTLGMKF